MELLKKHKSLMYSINWYINLAVLFLLSLHIGGYSSKKIAIWSLLSITLFAALNNKIVIDWKILSLTGALMLNGFIFEYYFGGWEFYDWWHMEDVLLPPMFLYIVCQQMAWRQDWKKIELIFWAISLGTFVYSALNYISYLQDGFIDGLRYWNNFWTRTPFYATEYSYWGVFIVGLLGYGLYSLFEKKWVMGLGVCALIVFENYINIKVDNRMIVMITVVVAVTNLLLYMYFNRKDMIKIKRILIIATLLVIIGSATLIFNIGGIRDTTYMTHFFSRDGGILNNIRFKAMWESIKMVPSHWKGGRTMKPAGLDLPHNYWLSVADDTGIFPFGLWMIFNIAGLVSLIKLIREPNLSQKAKYMIVPSLTAVVSYLMMETGGGGRSELIIYYVMLVAVVNRLVLNMKDNFKQQEENS